MPGLVPGIHVLSSRGKDVDGRVKPGHDGKNHSTSRSTASTTLRCSAVNAACGGTGSPTS
ncbi:hypothetical protein ES707_01544 [subsurface metagenome]